MNFKPCNVYVMCKIHMKHKSNEISVWLHQIHCYFMYDKKNVLESYMKWQVIHSMVSAVTLKIVGHSKGYKHVRERISYVTSTCESNEQLKLISDKRINQFGLFEMNVLIYSHWNMRTVGEGAYTYSLHMLMHAVKCLY